MTAGHCTHPKTSSVYWRQLMQPRLGTSQHGSSVCHVRARSCDARGASLRLRRFLVIEKMLNWRVAMRKGSGCEVISRSFVFKPSRLIALECWVSRVYSGCEKSLSARMAPGW
ncbi:hypothetical protein CC86DRAFT_88879 [Ophiobolus disseminans]|uniref:Uncharacterized protein n=1 Tax=Ophiobolus disseminans TaxID=1469910 RepID=A0A6A7AGD7_9PLEO|nr:hypothetical protein CC86DRAFT_88879 [Ophiobolus disseminans]